MNVSVNSVRARQAVAIVALVAALGVAGYFAPGLISGEGGGRTQRVAVGPNGQPGPIDILLPPEVDDHSPPVTTGPFRVVPQGFSYRTPSAASEANGALVDDAHRGAVAPSVLRTMPFYAEPTYLPPGYVIGESGAVIDSTGLKSYEVTYHGPRGYSFVVARIIGFILPYDIVRPLPPPTGNVVLTFGEVNGDPAAFKKAAPGEDFAEGSVIVSSPGYLTLVVGQTDGIETGRSMPFDELLKVAQSIR
jgi:hypothetical protein